MSEFTSIPDSVDIEEDSDVLSRKSPSGRETNRLRSEFRDMKFSLPFTNRTRAEKNIVRDFHRAKYARKTPFTWTNPEDGEEYTVRFDGPFSHQYVAYNIYNFNVTLMRVKS